MALQFVALDETAASSESAGLKSEGLQSRPLAEINPNAD
jgi:hypothetical protein